jgi:hypothetical protein
LSLLRRKSIRVISVLFLYSRCRGNKVKIWKMLLCLNAFKLNIGKDLERFGRGIASLTAPSHGRGRWFETSIAYHNSLQLKETIDDFHESCPAVTHGTAKIIHGCHCTVTAKAYRPSSDDISRTGAARIIF